MAETTVVREIYRKQEDGTVSSAHNIGSNFQNIIDDRPGQEGYTLAQFFDNYMSFIKNNIFVYTGPVKPTNTHIGIWIDTGSSNL